MPFSLQAYNELHAEEILRLEFEYARETATQAQTDRTVIVNLYLILVGGVGSLLLALASLLDPDRLIIPGQTLTLILGILGILGVLTLVKLVRLRQAWFESVRAMNSIKEYYLEQFPQLEPAFHWRTKTIPPLGKPWTITFVLSIMVVLLDSISFAAAMHFLELRQGAAQLILDAIIFILAFGLQVLFYFYQLRVSDVYFPLSESGTTTQTAPANAELLSSLRE